MYLGTTYDLDISTACPITFASRLFCAGLKVSGQSEEYHIEPPPCLCCLCLLSQRLRTRSRVELTSVTSKMSPNVYKKLPKNDFT